MEFLEELGPEKLTELLAKVPEADRSHAFAPDPRLCPELGEKLEQLREAGYRTEGIPESYGSYWSDRSSQSSRGGTTT